MILDKCLPYGYFSFVVESYGAWGKSARNLRDSVCHPALQSTHMYVYMRNINKNVPLGGTAGDGPAGPIPRADVR